MYFNLAYKLVVFHKIPKPFSASNCCLVFYTIHVSMPPSIVFHTLVDILVWLCHWQG